MFPTLYSALCSLYSFPVDSARLASLLDSYAPGLSPAQLAQISAYLDLLLRWNARINLTAVRDPENIVTRHFGESLFAARALLGGPPLSGPLLAGQGGVIDLGSGAGFPGLPLKIYAPALPLVLIESRHRKAAFLSEVVRALGLADVQVFPGRAEEFPDRAPLVTLRAVERFQAALPVAARLLAPGGRLALLIGSSQLAIARDLLPQFSWADPIDLPGSSHRVLLVGTDQEPQ